HWVLQQPTSQSRARAVDHRVALNATEAAREEFHDPRVGIQRGKRVPILVTPSTQAEAAAGQGHSHRCAFGLRTPGGLGVENGPHLSAALLASVFRRVSCKKDKSKSSSRATNNKWETHTRMDLASFPRSRRSTISQCNISGISASPRRTCRRSSLRARF